MDAHADEVPAMHISVAAEAREDLQTRKSIIERTGARRARRRAALETEWHQP
jgi:hypothetical protein